MKRLNRDYTGDGFPVQCINAQRTVLCVIMLTLTLTLTACRSRDQGSQSVPETTQEVAGAENAQTAETEGAGDMTDVSLGWTGETGWQGETASDGSVDLKAMQAINPDIFAWIYVPGTRIDYPVCRSADDVFYETADALKQPDENGAIFTEIANLPDMCDFNEIFHAAGAEGAPFADLAWFLEPAFFDTHREAYIFIEGNRLTYELFAAYRRENTSLLRLYDFTEESGCSRFITDLMMNRGMSTMFRTGYEDINPYHFLITLTGHTQGRASEGNEISVRIAQGESGLSPQGEQIVVLGVLTGDDAGTIDRNMNATDFYYELLD